MTMKYIIHMNLECIQLIVKTNFNKDGTNTNDIKQVSALRHFTCSSKTVNQVKIQHHIQNETNIIEIVCPLIAVWHQIGVAPAYGIIVDIFHI